MVVVCHHDSVYAVYVAVMHFTIKQPLATCIISLNMELQALRTTTVLEQQKLPRKQENDLQQAQIYT